MCISWKRIVILLLFTSTLIGMDKKTLDPYDNGKAYLIETEQEGKIEQHKISEIHLIRNLIKKINESLTIIGSAIKVDAQTSSAWKSLEQKFNDSHIVDIDTINALISQYSLNQLSTMATLLVTQAWMYDEIHQASEYLAKATEAIKRCPTQLVDLVTLPDAKEITGSALELVKFFIPDPIIEIEYLEHPAEIAAFMAVKHIVVKNLKQSSGLHELEVLNQLLQSPNQLIHRHALFAIRHYYLQKAYSIINRLEGFLINISLTFMNQLDCLHENKGLHNDIVTIEKMDLANDSSRYRSLLTKDVGVKSVSLVWDMHVGCSFDLAYLLQFIAKLNFCYACPCPMHMPDGLAQSLYIAAYDNKMRPVQLMLEEGLQKYCTQFEAKKEFYTAVYSLIHSRMQNLCTGPTKRKAYGKYFKMCDLLHEILKEQIVSQNGHPLPDQLVFRDIQVEIPESWQPVSQIPTCAAAYTHPVAQIKAKGKKKKKNASVTCQSIPLPQSKPSNSLAEAEKDVDHHEAPVKNCNDAVREEEIPQEPLAQNQAFDNQSAGSVSQSLELSDQQAPLAGQQSEAFGTTSSEDTLEQAEKLKDQVVAAFKPSREKKARKNKVVKICCQPTRPKWKLDWRIDRWFNTFFAQNYTPDEKLYHSFPLLINGYLRRHGITTQRQNASRLHQVDTVYSLPGEIHYTDLTRQYAVFNCTIDPDNVCYHRGITKKNGSQILNEFGQWVLDIHDINTPSTASDSGDWHKVCHDKKSLKRYGQIIESQQGYVNVRDSYNNVDCIVYLLDTASS